MRKDRISDELVGMNLYIIENEVAYLYSHGIYHGINTCYMKIMPQLYIEHEDGLWEVHRMSRKHLQNRLRSKCDDLIYNSNCNNII